MKLKTLEISGFKSFADKTVIDFVPGMTGVVGPNGSGKSNIIEAIQWVMGEQSAKDLRGSKMSDVIFGGTKTRKALNRAEVSIVFDNSDHYVKSDYAEIRLTRRLYRTGESVYQINGSDCRLRDIHELFMDTGLGREGFSIISQGRVESIFSAKPEERRGIIEEVAGVYKYKQNKQHAQRELAQTDDNLARLHDIIVEVEGRLEPLSQQAQQAQTYLAKREVFEKLDQERLAHELIIVNSQVSDQHQRLDQQNQALQASREAVATVQKQLQASRRDQLALQNKQEDTQAALVADTQTKEQLIASQQLAQEKMATLIRDQAKLVQEQADLSQEQDQNQQALEQKDQQVADWQAEQAHLQQTINQLDAEHGGQRLTAVQKQIEEGRHRYIDQLQRVANLRNQHGYQAKNIQQLQQKAIQNETELTAAQASLSQANDELTIYQVQVSHQSSDSQHTVSNQIQEQETALAHERQQYREIEQQYRQAERRLDQRRSRYEALKSLDDYAGFYQGVRNLMVPAVRNDFPGIRGVVAELMQVPKQYTKAIEIVLGGALQQVVVDTTQTAKAIVRYMTHKRKGRVTILPLDAIRSRQLKDMDQVANIDGYIGVAADLVIVPAEMAAIKGHLLGTTVVVRDLDAATRIAKRVHQRFRVVSLDGQLVNAGGSITGGANQHQTNTLLSRQNQLQEQAHLIEIEAAALMQLGQQRDQLEASGQRILTTLQELKDHAQQYEQQSHQTDYELTRKQDAVDQATRLVKTMRQEQTDLAAEIASLEAEQARTYQNWQIAQTEQAHAEEQNQRLGEELTVLNRDLASVDAEKATIQNQLVAVRTRLEGGQTELARLQDEAKRIQKALEESQQQAVTYQAQLAQIKQPEVLAHDLAEISERLAAAQVTSQEQQQAWQELTAQIQEFEAGLTRQQAQLNQNSREQSHAQIELNQLIRRQDSLASELLTQYGIEADADLKQYASEKSLTMVKTALQDVKIQLNQLGDVNVGAIQEYETTQARYDFLTKQQADLNEAKAILQTTIDELDQEVQTRFKITFDTVAQHFETVFYQMFGGGQAHIELTDPNHLLTTGIDITAQPPGKKFQHMSLLSGGEKALTAISLLFAILQVRPVPFVVLDEAEAALDEANVDRFAQYLKNFAGSTQFITITHRKGTMVNATVLYGVTMQEAGVSKMVAVNLDHVH